MVVRHFIEHVRDLTGMIYGRRVYEIMRYWEEDLPDWDAEERNFAAVWRSMSAAAKMRAILEEPFEPFCERSIAALAPPFPCRRIPGERGVLPVR